MKNHNYYKVKMHLLNCHNNNKLYIQLIIFKTYVKIMNLLELIVHLNIKNHKIII